MPQLKPHLYFKNPVEGVVTYKPKVRNPREDKAEEPEETIDYTPKKEDFTFSKERYLRNRTQRITNRNPDLDISIHAEYIDIEFHNTFDSSFFESRYRRNFGLSPVKYYEFNTKVVFVVVDNALFLHFLNEIDVFINTDDSTEVIPYNPDIKFIKKFDLLNTQKIISYSDIRPHIIIDLVENVEIFSNVIDPLERRMVAYLTEKGITHFLDIPNGKIELLNVSQETVTEIANNFDIIHSINSFSAGIIRPSRFNLQERTFGFTITNAAEDLPIIGIIDTGISNQSPIAELIINDGNEFDLTGTSPRLDSGNHGTAVAALAALGKRLYPNHVGNFEADAKLLSIKVLGGQTGNFAETQIIKLIREAFIKYSTKIFTLTIAYNEPKGENELVSDYAYALDRLSNELNILIFIAIGNFRDLTILKDNNFVPVTYPEHFEDSKTNLFAPSESMNNICVGAVAGNLENNDSHCISPSGEFPAIYTRKFHINWTHMAVTKTKLNKLLFKPDISYYGGDFDKDLNPERTGIKTISTIEGEYFGREAGTSFATPLAANIAAKLLRVYPSLANNMQTVKAIILNSASCPPYGDFFKNAANYEERHLIGHGIPNEANCIYSNANSITLILEDNIMPESIKCYPIKVPKYLLNLERVSSLLKVNATLCFKFDPIKNNHFCYCPIHMAFGLFRNIPLEATDDQGHPAGINSNLMDEVAFKKSWSQDYYFKSKLLSNVQKQTFVISKKDLIEEDCTFKIAVNSKLHKQLNALQKTKYTRNVQFSIVISIEENKTKKRNTGRLYDEMLAVNTLQNIADLTTDLEADLE